MLVVVHFFPLWYSIDDVMEIRKQVSLNLRVEAMLHSPQVDGGFCLFGLLTKKCVNYDDCFLIPVPFVICMMLNQKRRNL